MSHDAHPNPNLHDDPAGAPLALLGVIGTFGVVVSIIIITAAYFQFARNEEAKLYESPIDQVKEVHRIQERRLNQDYRIIDEAERVVAMKIDDAIRIVAKELAAGGSGLAARPPADSTPTTRPSAGQD